MVKTKETRVDLCSFVSIDSLKMILRCRNMQELILTMNYILWLVFYCNWWNAFVCSPGDNPVAFRKYIISYVTRFTFSKTHRPCRLVDTYRRFEALQHLNLKGQAAPQEFYSNNSIIRVISRRYEWKVLYINGVTRFWHKIYPHPLLVTSRHKTVTLPSKITSQTYEIPPTTEKKSQVQ